MSIYVGYKGDVRYGQESNGFRAGTVSDLTRRFGYGQSVSRVDITRENEDIRTLGDRRLQEVVGKAERNAITVSAYLSSVDELGIIGKTYLETPPSYVVGLLLGTPAGDQSLLLFKGSVPREFELEVNAGEAARIEVSFTSAEVEIVTGSFTLPSATMGSAIYVAWSDQSNITLNTTAGAFTGIIRSLTLSVSENPRLYYTLGDRRAKAYAYGAYEITLQATALYNNPQIIQDYLNTAQLDTVQFTLGDALGNENPVTFTVGGVVRVTGLGVRVPVVEPGEVSFTLKARVLSVSGGGPVSSGGAS